MTTGPAVKWRSGAASDAGLVRRVNEDRYWIDDDRGVFLVVDGMGGHAAGELAAQTAVEVIREQLLTGGGSAEERVLVAITRANNRIFELASGREDLRGMACVLTLALVDDGRITIGHVGDSRFYVIWNGVIRKLTSDHSPVGECEDAGELSQEEAMRHPRRHEVFRDVGSQQREADDENFIEIRSCRFKPDAAFLLCSDGLTDQLTSGQVREIVERYAGDPEQVVSDLVQAANAAGGRDNTTAVLIAGPQFPGGVSTATAEMKAFESDPGPPAGRRSRFFAGRVAFLIYGLLIGMLVWTVLHIPRG